MPAWLEGELGTTNPLTHAAAPHVVIRAAGGWRTARVENNLSAATNTIAAVVGRPLRDADAAAVHTPLRALRGALVNAGEARALLADATRCLATLLAQRLVISAAGGEQLATLSAAVELTPALRRERDARRLVLAPLDELAGTRTDLLFVSCCVSPPPRRRARSASTRCVRSAPRSASSRASRHAST